MITTNYIIFFAKTWDTSVSICQNCINFLRDTPIDPSILSKYIKEALTRIIPYRDKEDIINEVRKQEYRNNGLLKNIFNTVFKKDEIDNKILKISNENYNAMTVRINIDREKALNDLINGKYKPIDTYQFLKKGAMTGAYHGALLAYIGHGEKSSFEPFLCAIKP